METIRGLHWYSGVIWDETTPARGHTSLPVERRYPRQTCAAVDPRMWLPYRGTPASYLPPTVDGQSWSPVLVLGLIFFFFLF